MSYNDDQLSHQQPGKKARINMFYDLGKKVTHINEQNNKKCQHIKICNMQLKCSNIIMKDITENIEIL